MYIKVSDNIGMSTLRIFNYVEEIPNNNVSTSVTVNNDLDLTQYVRKDELSKLIKELIGNEQSLPTTDAAGPAPSTTSPGPAKVTILKK
jgi:hypothetical protein